MTLCPSLSSVSSHLLPGVGGEVEHQHGEEGDAHAGDDEVHGVEQSLPPHGDVEGDVQVGLVAARVDLHVPEDSQLSVGSLSTRGTAHLLAGTERMSHSTLW